MYGPNWGPPWPPYPYPPQGPTKPEASEIDKAIRTLKKFKKFAAKEEEETKKKKDDKKKPETKIDAGKLLAFMTISFPIIGPLYVALIAQTFRYAARVVGGP